MKSYKEYASKDWVQDKLANIEIKDLSAVAFSGSYNDLLDKPTYMILKDIGNSLDYVVQLKNGAFIITSKATSMEITTMPNKTEYAEGKDLTLDLTGMVVTLYREDGTNEIIENYTYTETRTDSNLTVIIEYTEFGQTFSETLEFNITPFDPEIQLVDFEYTNNGDGTYTITDWKQTLNGEPSTELIIPDNSRIKL
jgi:hypothetical protein